MITNYLYLLKFEIVLFLIILIFLEFNRMVLIPFLINKFQYKILKKIDEELRYLITVEFKREIDKEFKNKKNKEELLKIIEDLLIQFLNKIAAKYNKISILLNPLINRIVKEVLESNKELIEEKIELYYNKIEKRKNLDKFYLKIYLLFKDLIEKNRQKILEILKEKIKYLMFWLNLYFMIIYLISIIVLNLICFPIY